MRGHLSIIRLAFASALTVLCTAFCAAQGTGVLIDNLRSMRVEVNGVWNSAPVATMDRGNRVVISFDDLQHNYVRYTYRVTHCNADWTESDIPESDYMDGFNGSRIEKYAPSMNTAMLYNHYTLTFPNEDVRLKISGNYRVDIFEDGDDEPVAYACFSMLEPRVGISATATGNTDIDAYKSHQQVSFEVNYSTYNVNHPETELKPVVVQNKRWDTAVSGLRPSYLKTNTLVFSHLKQLIFDAGNEYRRFEILDEHVPTMRVETMRYAEPYYHATIMEDEPRTNYIYDEDQNGRYYVRNGENVDNDTESDYFITHFILRMPELANGEIYIDGDFTDHRLTEDCLMEYDQMEHAYSVALPLKQGSYNYQYLFLPDGESYAITAPIEGNFFQTENEYAIYIYHRPFGERYDHLVGYAKLNTKDHIR